MITKSDDRAAGVRFVDHEYDYRPNWTTRSLITQAVRPGFKFRLSFFFPRSVTNRPRVFSAHASPLHTYSTWNLQKLSSGKVSMDSFISRAMKSFPNEHTVRGRPTLKDVKSQYQ